jgi:hypothetical protein
MLFHIVVPTIRKMGSYSLPTAQALPVPAVP